MILEKEFYNYEHAKNRIVYELYNKSTLKEADDENGPVAIPYLDMAISFRYIIGVFQDEIASVRITNAHLKAWGVSTKDLMISAKVNTPKILPVKLMSMSEALEKMVGKDFFADYPEYAMTPLYVLTNEYSTRGAAAMLYPDIVRNFAEDKGSNLIIIPSSIHEAILVPDQLDMEPEDYARLIRQVNSTEVLPDEVLSDHPYYFRLGQDKILQSVAG